MNLSSAENSQKVTEHIAGLDASLIPTVEAIRTVILNADDEIGEQIKWNSPSFYYTGEMKAFNAKEYKRDIVVLNLHRGKILLVFPTGDKIPDTSGLLEGKYTDGRRIITFKDLADVTGKQNILQKILKDWLALVER